MTTPNDTQEASKQKRKRTRKIKGAPPKNSGGSSPNSQADGARANSANPSSADTSNADPSQVVRRRRLVGPVDSQPSTAPAARPSDTSPAASSPAENAPGKATQAKSAASPPVVPPPAKGRRANRMPAQPAKPEIGDSRPAPKTSAPKKRGRRRDGRNRGQRSPDSEATNKVSPVETITADEKPVELDKKQRSRRRGAQRDGEPLGRYRMLVSVKGDTTHVSITEGRVLIEHYIGHPADAEEIDGNIYLGYVRRVHPGIDTAFLDIGTDKNAVIHRQDAYGVTTDNSNPSALLGRADADNTNNPGESTGESDSSESDKSASKDVRPDNGRSKGFRVRKESGARIEHVLKAGQPVLCQVLKKPIGHKGARLTTEVSLPGRFVVLVPNSSVIGVSRRMEARVAKRLRSTLKSSLPEGFGAIVRTAAEHVTAEEISRDVERLVAQWQQIVELSKEAKGPNLLFKEPEMALRTLREEFSSDFREVIVDDPDLHKKIRSYMETIAAPSVDRVTLYDTKVEPLPLMEKYQVTEQLRKAVDSKVWLPSGGSLIIEHTEALTVIDVNTGKNTGSSSLDETLFINNLEAAEEVARQLRLRDIGGIIVIDFVDMESKQEQEQLVLTLRTALARDKTRFSVESVSKFGVVQMTRKRVGEGLLESVTHKCENCDGLGLLLDDELLSA